MIEVEARKALVTSLGSSVSSAASQAHLLWIVQGMPATIDMQGQAITMLNGYPNEASIDNTVMDYSGFQYQNASTARFRRQDASQPNTCMVTYADAVAGARPAVISYTSGC
jgi:MSHA pilin protein MshA